MKRKNCRMWICVAKRRYIDGVVPNPLADYYDIALQKCSADLHC